MTPTTPVLPTPVWYSTPSLSSSPATTWAVRCSSKPSSGWACRSRRSAVSSGCWLRRKSMGPIGVRDAPERTGSVRRHQPLDPQARIDGIVEQVDGEVDEHEDQRDEAQ